MRLFVGHKVGLEIEIGRKYIIVLLHPVQSDSDIHEEVAKVFGS